ncbi:Sialidase precursor [Actinomyces bovis]|uniref:exo-alpha-sialidase n=1 Tax=Actinomyces bovis TaxID=1658 RepID=A0ABY1VNA6_9ACTO|nr:exo-alpha-sialidase [Actinomyces bovis]SPT53576.1 Sialidase precursor [Actinomyces bovis]VEG55574.1 Sialidase precursor [Actinomyces israelii]
MRTQKSSRHGHHLRRPLGTLGALALAGAVLTFPAAPASAIPTEDGAMDVTITLNNPNPDHRYQVGDVLTYTIQLKNTSGSAHSFQLEKSNLEGNVAACKWRTIQKDETKSDCNNHAQHRVTADDLTRGSFTPEASFTMRAPGSHTGKILNTPQTIKGEPTPIKRPAVEVERITVSPAKDSYAVGDTITLTPRIRSVWGATTDVSVPASNFGVTNECNWQKLPANDVYNCQPITYTIKQADAEAGSWTPSITVKSALTSDKSELHTLTFAGDPIKVTGSWPQAQPGISPSADENLAAAMSERQALATTTSTDNYRIPAIAVAPNGDLLASYDERPKDNGNKGGDSPNPNHIVQRRSTDNGKNWGVPTYIHQGIETGFKKEGYSDPSYVVDYETGKIFNFHVKSYDVRFQDSVAGTDPAARNVLHAEVSTSTDNGHTWTHREITTEVDAGINAKSRFAASGQGIQMRNHPKHKGRLVQQFTVKRANDDYQAVSLFSDNHGETWTVGTPVGTRMDENKVVELSDGTLMMNSRDSANSGYRKVAKSTDGGATWGEVTLDRSLPDPTNNAQIIRLYPNAPADDPKASMLLFTNTAGSGRTQGTISLSCDNGTSWAARKTFYQPFTGYSTIAVQQDGTIGLLSEDDSYSGIYYRNFTLAWAGSHCTQPNASATASAATVYPGKDATVTVTVKNPTGKDLTGVTVTAPSSEVVALTPTGEVPTTVPAKGQAVFTFTAKATGLGEAALTFPVAFAGGPLEASVKLVATAGPDVSPEAIAADSQELVGETAPNGPISAAVDGDPNTFWHTEWKNAAPGFDPVTGHWIDLKVKESDVPADQTPHIVGLNYTARQNSDMGRAKDYKIFTSADGKTWSEQPVTTGTLQNTKELQRIPLDVKSRYVRFMAMNNYSTGKNARFLVAGELSLTLKLSAPEPEPNATMPAYVSKIFADSPASVLKGDWDGDGTVTYAVRVGTRVVFYNENRTDAPVYASVSLGRAADELLVGDWDNDGKDTLALRRGTTVLTQTRLTSSATTKVNVEGITASSKLTVHKESGKADVIVVVK